MPDRPSITAEHDVVRARPRVLFVCVKNGGKSQMAEALMRHVAGDGVDAASAGTRAGTAVNTLSADSLLELGIDIRGNTPRQLTADLVDASDLVVVLGQDAEVDPGRGTPVERWETDEPSERGIEGIERMRLVRDDILDRVAALNERLTPSGPNGP
ncbi:low molecular weight phosphatase family protein [Kineosporia sp. R_H_3]|uniref:arsenate-mycothiol transferase ArsC n=1 Tax=Kineosporia sp. R_H_3 TaxID=1961848 RepID=UPI001E5DFB59|nr:low molecular weight phosphatase family protein [Kineosporia sp. R_H_3]